MLRKLKSFRFLSFVSLFSLVLNLLSPLIFLSSLVAAQTPSTNSSLIKLSYDSNTHLFTIQLPANQQITTYQLIYQHLDDQGNLINESVTGKLTLNGNQETATLYIGTKSGGVGHPHLLRSGIVTLSPENIHRRFIIQDGQLWYADDDQFTHLSSSTPIQLNHSYSFPNQPDYQITFTQLPSSPGHLFLKRLSLSSQQRKTLGALADFVYDLSTDMPQGSYRFTLRFPLPTNLSQDDLYHLAVAYLENLNQSTQPDKIHYLPQFSLQNGYVVVSNIDHMTIFLPLILPSCPVTINSDSTCYPTIQAAIDAANPHDTVKVNPGDYHESLVINKPLNLTSTQGYQQTNLISPSNTAITIASDQVTLSGFNIETANQDGPSKYGVYFQDHSSITIENNRFRNLVSTTDQVYGIAAVSTNQDVDQLKIANNVFVNLHGNQTSAAIALGWSSPQTHWFNQSSIMLNRINQLTSDAKGAYGLLINHQTRSALIKGNTIKNLTGSWTHALGLEGDTPAIQVINNKIDHLTVTNPTSASIAVFVEDNPSAVSPTDYPQLHGNRFSNLDYGLVSIVGLLGQTRIDATQNWWGADNGPYDNTADNLTFPDINPNGSGVGVWGLVDYHNWITDSTAPQILLTQPTNNSYQRDTIHLQATCNETCDYVNFWWRRSNESYSSSSKRWHRVGTDGTTFEWNLNSLNAEKADGTTYRMTDGVYYFYAAGKDLAGNWTKTPETKITLDNTPPTTTFNTPTGITNGVFNLSGHASDNFHLNRVYVQLVNRINNKRYGGTTINLISQNNSATWSRSYKATADGLPDGTYAAHVTVVDMAGNTYDSGWTNDFIVDTTPPTTSLTIIGNLAEAQNLNGDSGWHGNGWYHDYSSLTFQINSGDQLNDLISYQILAGDQNCPAAGDASYHQTATHNTNIANQVNGQDGVHTLCYYGVDQADNQESVHKQLLKIDTQPPTHTIQYATINGRQVNQVYYLNQPQLNVDITVADILSGYTRTRYDLYQADSQGQCQTDPTLRFSGDDLGHYWQNDNLVPAVASTTRTLTRTGIPDGHYCLRIWTYDDVQNKAWVDTNNQLWVNFVVDTQPPTVTVDSQVINHASPTITGTVSDDRGVDRVEVTINGETHQATLNSDGTWTILQNTFTPLVDGTYEVVAIAYDLAGNHTTDSTTQELQIDTVPPTATFSHYLDGQVLGANNLAYAQHVSQLTFSGIYLDQLPSSFLKQDSFVIFDAQSDGSFAFENNGAQAYCSWQGTSNTLALSGTSDTLNAINFSLCVNSLNEGEYYLAHKVYDQATRWDMPTLTQFRDILGLHFFIDRTQPTVAASVNPPTPDGDNGWYVTQPTIFLTATDDVALDHIEYHWDSDSWSTYTQPLQPTEGTHTLFYRSVDKAGNYSEEKSLTFKFDQTYPTPPQNLDVVDITNDSAKVTWQAASDNINIDHYTVEWNLQGESYVYNHTVDANTFELTIDSLSPGLWHVRVLAVDPAGNVTVGYHDFNLNTSVPSPTPTPSPSPTPIPSVLGVQTTLTSSSPSPTTSPSPSSSPTATGEIKGASTQAPSPWRRYLPWFTLSFFGLLLIWPLKKKLLH